MKLLQIVKPSPHLSTAKETAIEIHYRLYSALDPLKLNKYSDRLFGNCLDLEEETF